MSHGPVTNGWLEGDTALYHELRRCCGARGYGCRSRPQVGRNGTAGLRGVDDAAVCLSHRFTKRGSAPHDARSTKVGLVGVGLGGHLRGPEGLAGLSLDVDAVVRPKKEVDEIGLSETGYIGGLARHIVFGAGLTGR